jgi:uncharacterized metal-binding protein
MPCSVSHYAAIDWAGYSAGSVRTAIMIGGVFLFLVPHRTDLMVLHLDNFRHSNEAECLELVTLFVCLEEAELRHKVLDLVKALAMKRATRDAR